MPATPRPRPGSRPSQRLITALRSLANARTGPRYDAYEADTRIYVITPAPGQDPRRLTADQIPAYLAGLTDAANAIMRAAPDLIADLPRSRKAAAALAAAIERDLHAAYAASHAAAVDTDQPTPQ